MRLKNILGGVLLIIDSLGVILFVVLLMNSAPKDSTWSNSPLPAKNIAATTPQRQEYQEPERAALPVRLRIPSIDVDAPIEYVGLDADGAMDVPEGPDDVAWFNLGPRPGEVGSAVLAGHYGWKNNIPAAFDHLHELQIGDTIAVEDADGSVITFVVREMKIYGKDDIVSDVFSSSGLGAHLNLVTCTGVWNENQKTYAERLVVFTDRE